MNTPKIEVMGPYQILIVNVPLIITVIAQLKAEEEVKLINGSACTIELWCTPEFAKHERSVRVARGYSRERL